MGFGSTIREARQALKQSQSQLAEVLGTSQTNLSGWERDEYRPGPAHILALAKELDLDAGELLTLAAVPIAPIEATA